MRQGEPADSALWLGPALRDFDELTGGLDFGPGTSSKTAVCATRALLRALAVRVPVEPVVDAFLDAGVAVELEAADERLTILVRPDGSLNCYERAADGRRTRARFASVQDFVSATLSDRCRRTGSPSLA